jgi:chemotaxis protein methyltransferase CheR
MPTVIRAREGIYEDNQFREMPVELKEKYFEKVPNEWGFSYKPLSFISAPITFEHGDILENQPSGMDAVFCRNTVIYFDTDTKSRLYENVYNVLPSKGFFIMGKTETLLGPSRDKFETFNFDERVYQRP